MLLQMLHQIGADGLYRFHLGTVKIWFFRSASQFQGVEIQQQLQNLYPKVGHFDPLRYGTKLLENVIHRGCSVNDLRPGIRAEFPLNGGQIQRIVSRQTSQFHGCHGQVKAHGDAMIVGQRERKVSFVLQAAIHFQVTCLHIGERIVAHSVFHPALPAIVDAEEILSGFKRGVAIGHVEIVIQDGSAGEHLIDGHGSLAALISQLINAAPTTLGQEAQIRLAVL